MFETKKFDLFLFLPVLLLLIFSIGMILSVQPGIIGDQIFYILISLGLFFGFSLINYSVLISLSPILYISCLIFLILPFVFGSVTRGSVRWIPIGNYTIQPSEIIKPFLCVIAAWFWEKKQYSLVNLLKFFGLFLPFLILIFLQPDLGSTLVVFSIFVGSVLFSGIKIKQVLFLLLSLVLSLPILWFSLKDYQKNRVYHFLNPMSDPLGEGYNQIQAKIAVGSGQFFGWGLGRGSQSHLLFLPERHTDFIFSSMAEEFGFFGSTFLLLIYFYLFLRVLKVAKSCPFRSGFFLTMAIYFNFVFQTIVNVSMNLGLVPITGITLPLFSYGGSSLLASLIGLGIIANISKNNSLNKIVSIKHF
jgi:rod shape determining protein RodA